MFSRSDVSKHQMVQYVYHFRPLLTFSVLFMGHDKVPLDFDCVVMNAVLEAKTKYCHIDTWI